MGNRLNLYEPEDIQTLELWRIKRTRSCEKVKSQIDLLNLVTLSFCWYFSFLWVCSRLQKAKSEYPPAYMNQPYPVSGLIEYSLTISLSCITIEVIQLREIMREYSEKYVFSLTSTIEIQMSLSWIYWKQNGRLGLFKFQMQLKLKLN